MASLVAYLINVAGNLGYMGIVFIVGLEYACFPIPSEVVLPFVGISVVAGEFTFIRALIASIIGGLLGSLICYAIGFNGGVPLLEWSSKKWPKTKKTIVVLNKWFAKYGNIAVLLTRVFPLTRTYISILAGAEKLRLGTFIGYSLVGIVAWNTLLISLGYFLGDNLALIEQIVRKYSVAVGILAVIGIGILVLRYFKKKN
ncbi:MAG: DedA family protein [Cellulosilyticaceae bacterium]